VSHFADATRVQLICPCGNVPLLRAANAILAKLLEEVVIQEWGGFTYSSLTPPVFFGQFWDTSQQGQPPAWEEDQSVLITIDAPAQTVSSVLTYFTALREMVNSVYQEVGESQKELWITAHPLSILVDD